MQYRGIVLLRTGENGIRFQRKRFVRFINIVCHNVSANVGLKLLGSQMWLESVFMHEMASCRFQV